MSVMELRNNDGTYRCCGGYGEHFDWCNFSPERPIVRLEDRRAARRQLDKDHIEQHYNEQAFMAQALTLMTYVERWLQESRAFREDKTEDIQREVQYHLTLSQMAATFAHLGGYDGEQF